MDKLYRNNTQRTAYTHCVELTASELRTILPDVADALDDAQLTRLAAYLKLVDEYRGTLNLTGYSGTNELARGLVGESLRLNSLNIIEPGQQVIDLGSGNGSPVVPLAIACPEVRFAAVESRMKRGAFLQRVRAVVKITNLSVRVERAEATAAIFPWHYDCAISRGFAKPRAFLQMAASLVKPGGSILGYCGESTDAVTDAASEMNLAGLSFTAYQGVSGTCHIFSVANKS